MKPLYELRLDLRVLDHLGMKLYSNAAAVLSEAVANAWDADAPSVDILVSNEEIVIEDSGTGMTLTAINDRFLKVGYAKRAGEGDVSAGGRRFMGRKGIGKLALFSIADEIQVHTSTGKEKRAFRMYTPEIRRTIEVEEPYYPDPIEFAGPEKGTRIVLRELRKKRTSAAVPALRRRIARRFSVIGFEGTDDQFVVSINGSPIGPGDREDLQAIEYLWEFGERRVDAAAAPRLKERFVLDDEVSGDHPEWRVGGWFGASAKPRDLSRTSGSINGLVVIARGRLIQENILDRLNFSRVLVSYITGQIEADFLDISGEDDIATSDRQRVVEDDERYEALRDFLREKIVNQQDKWTDLRVRARGKEATEEHPALATWIASLPEAQRPPAERLLGLIGGIELDREEDRLQLYRSGMLAFERLKIREASHLLVGATSLTAEQLLPILSDVDALEGSLYLEIIRGRLEVLRKFTGLVDANARERVLQQHLFENLWLLDPGWERAAGSERVEQTLKKDYKEWADDLSARASRGRVDIRYKTNGGEHMIIELKRARRKLSAFELLEQGNGYRDALRHLLTKMGKPHDAISVVFVVGEPVNEYAKPDGAQFVKEVLAPIHGRVVHYEELIADATDAYAEYLKEKEKVDTIGLILEQLR